MASISILGLYLGGWGFGEMIQVGIGEYGLWKPMIFVVISTASLITLSIIIINRMGIEWNTK